MKHAMKRFVKLLILCFLTSGALFGLVQAQVVKLKGAVYSPYPGVICDRKAGFCADSEGIAVALTNEVACDCKLKKCKVNKYEERIDTAHTRAQFGK